MPAEQAIENAYQGSRARLETLAQYSDNPGLVQVRAIPHVQPYGIVIVETDGGSVRVYVKLMAFRVDKLPCLDVNDPADGMWAEFFARQFEQLWSVSAPVSFAA